MAVTLIWLIFGTPGYALAMVMLRLGNTLEVRCFGFQVHVSMLNHYPDVVGVEAHPDDVTTHLWAAGGGCRHSLPVPLMMLHGSPFCRETSLSPEGPEMPSEPELAPVVIILGAGT